MRRQNDPAQRRLKPEIIREQWMAVDAAELHVVESILIRRDSNGWTKLSMDDLKHLTRMSEPTIRKAVRSLTKKGCLEIEGEKKDAKGRPTVGAGAGNKNRYRVHESTLARRAPQPGRSSEDELTQAKESIESRTVSSKGSIPAPDAKPK